MRNCRFVALGWLLLTGALVLVGSACVASIQANPPRSVFVATAPPEPLPEFKSGPPAPGMAWLAGYWHFNGTEYVWIPGHWESPRPGLSWRPPTVVYSPENHVWVYQHGRWEPDANAVR